MIKNLDKERKIQENPILGIVLAGGTGSRLHPCTIAINKQLLPVYDKPLIYYPISVLMLNDIRRIAIICSDEDLPRYHKLFGDGSVFGCEFIYRIQEKPEGLPQAFTITEDLIGAAGCYLILGDNIFHGSDITHKVQPVNTSSATIFTKNVSNPENFGVLARNAKGKVIQIVEKPISYISSEAILGLYYFPNGVAQRAKDLHKSERGEYEITDLIKTYLAEVNLDVRTFGRGTAWFDTGTVDSLLAAANYIKTIQNEQHHQIANLEEIALNKGWISKSVLTQAIANKGNSNYYRAVRKLTDK